VCYEGEFAPDLAEVAHHAGLSPDEVAQRHAAAAYRVGCVGFMPGFPYLTGLPPELATPRRAIPRREVAAGSVAIGGSQTGIYPSVSPGGWNVIGRTPLRLFDVTRQPPALLRAGDAVRFRAISRTEFESLAR
jgi:inhibitor of KinA